jgi:hypothetical protein
MIYLCSFHFFWPLGILFLTLFWFFLTSVLIRKLITRIQVRVSWFLFLGWVVRPIGQQAVAQVRTSLCCRSWSSQLTASKKLRKHTPLLSFCLVPFKQTERKHERSLFPHGGPLSFRYLCILLSKTNQLWNEWCSIYYILSLATLALQSAMFMGDISFIAMFTVCPWW